MNSVRRIAGGKHGVSCAHLFSSRVIFPVIRGNGMCRRANVVENGLYSGAGAGERLDGEEGQGCAQDVKSEEMGSC
eukprot:COSAG02_NODE_1687_length_11318_cov_2.699349_6_plen_76_part_00